LEHKRWLAERKASGWTFGEKKSIEHKESPYMVSWEELPPDIQNLDKDTALNIIPLLDRAGLVVYRK